MGKKYILFLIVFFASFFGFAQNITIGAGSMPATVVGCGDNATFAFRAFDMPSGTTINVALPPGAKFVAVSSGIATGVATTTGATFTLTAAASAGGSLIEYTVATACSPTIASANNPKVTYSSTVLGAPVATDYPSVSYPLLEIASVTAVGSTAINVGQAATYDVFVEQSNAYSNTIMVEVRHKTAVTLSLDNPAIGTITPGTPSGGFQTDLITINPSQISTVGNNNSKFEDGEGYTFKVKATLTTCSANGESLEFHAVYGCDGSLCLTGNTTTGGLTQNGAGTPSLTMRATKAPYAGIFGQADDFVLELTNNGTGYAKDVLIQLGVSSGGNLYVPSKYNVFNFYDVKVNGVAVNETGTDTDYFRFNFTSDPDGPGGFEDLDGDGLFNEIAPGNKVIITGLFTHKIHQLTTNCVERPTQGGVNMFRWRLDFKNACNVLTQYAEPNNDKGANQLFNYQNSNSVLIVEGTDVENTNYSIGDTFYLNFVIGAEHYLNLYPSRNVGATDSFVRLKVVLPDGVVPHPTINPAYFSGLILDSEFSVSLNLGASDAASNTYYYDIYTNIDYLRMATGRSVKIPLIVGVNCNNTGTFEINSSVLIAQSETQILPIEFTCRASNAFTLVCGSPTGLALEKFDLKRQTFGSTDLAGNIPVTETTPGIRMNHYLNGDKAMASYRLRIIDPNMTSAKLNFEYDKHIAEFFKEVDGQGGVKQIDVTYTDPDTNIATSFTIMPANFGADMVVYRDSYIVDGIENRVILLIS